MRGYESNGFRQRVDDYEEDYDHDEYEEEASEAEEEEREAPKPTREEQDFLKLREQLKDKFRRKLKTQTASDFGRVSSTQVKRTAVPNDKFGSFFGPSKPVIAPRVIEESRSIRETKHIVAKASSSSSKRDPLSSEVKPKAHYQQPKVVNETKKKAQTLKDMRDYSFLLSDDSDLPSPAAKEAPSSRNVSVPRSDGRPSQELSKKSKLPTMSKPASSLASNGRESKNLVSTNRHVQTKVGSTKEAPPNRHTPASTESIRKVVSSGVANGPRQVVGSKALTQKVPVRSADSHRRSADSHRPIGKVPMHSADSQRPIGKVPVQSTDSRRSIGKVVNDPGLKKNSLPVKPHASTTQNRYPEQKRIASGLDKVKIAPKQPIAPKKPLPSSKPQPSKQISSHATHDDRPKKKPAKRPFEEDDDEDGELAIGMIRKMFGYDPSRYAGMDEDDSDMEVGFDKIQKEERRSSKIARKEDEEQLRLIEEEERREQMRKKQKLLRER
ncbi:protein SPT2 homolog [Ananas comosus]|uniref:Protein SPT2 homolog n=2 Tax=Ananas comosus TaxID=4615 RepID=A0A6P5EUG6_ANACO|nr:protein SPT2 homolog [Ananas comosus]XP_020087126.1 protein SPT2 homolog [Ananas comosus]XP_020087127.1 protein SPT2 homolog [Ananas comosus]CAD1828296.1 unnamed protein product [Ananas comosus var. bracteatus]